MTAFPQTPPAVTEQGTPPGASLSAEAIVDQAYAEFFRRYQAGETIDIEAFCGQYPGHRSSVYRTIEAELILRDHPSALANLPPPPAPPRVDWPRPEELLGDLRVIRELGRGGFARVYLAAEPSAGDRPVVIKVSKRGSGEARYQARLAHDHIVPVLWAGRHPATNLHLLCMPFLGSATLLGVLDRAFPTSTSSPPRSGKVILEAIAAAHRPGDPAPDQALLGPNLAPLDYPRAVASLGAQVARALELLHGRGVAHCDLKPENVLLTPGGRAMVMDFNLSRANGAPIEGLGGTFAYMAPEALRAWLAQEPLSPEASARADLYSLGAMLYQLLTGALPNASPPPGNQADMARWALAHFERPRLPVRALNPRLGAGLAHLVEQCLSLQADARPASAAHVAAALARAARPARWWPATAACGAALALVAAVAAARPMASEAPQPMAKAPVHRAEGHRQLALGWAALGTGQRDRARQALRAADGAFQQAIDEHKREMKEERGSWEDYFGRGRALMLAGDPSQARAVFTEARQAKGPRGLSGRGEAQLWACQGYCEAALGEHLRSIESYERAMTAGLRSAAVRNNLAYSYLRQRRIDRARPLLEEALRMERPAPRAALWNRAEAALMQHLRGRGADRGAPLPLWVSADLERVLQMPPPPGEQNPTELYRMTALAHARALAGKPAHDLAAADRAWRQRRIGELVRLAVERGASPTGLVKEPSLQAALGPWFVAENLPPARKRADLVNSIPVVVPLGDPLD